MGACGADGCYLHIFDRILVRTCVYLIIIFSSLDKLVKHSIWNLSVTRLRALTEFMSLQKHFSIGDQFHEYYGLPLYNKCDQKKFVFAFGDEKSLNFHALGSSATHACFMPGYSLVISS